MELTSHPAFTAYAISAAILVLKMIIVGHYVGVLRIMKKVYLNPEDAKNFSQMDEVVSHEDLEVAKGLRAHRNDLESTLPFLIIAPIYLAMGASAGLATTLIAAFTVFRIFFSVFYLTAFQPWRSLSFLAGEVCLIVMLVQILYWGLTG